MSAHLVRLSETRFIRMLVIKNRLSKVIESMDNEITFFKEKNSKQSKASN